MSVRMCECGFGTDSPVLWGVHRDDNPDHKDYDPGQIPELAPADDPRHLAIERQLDELCTEISRTGHAT